MAHLLWGKVYFQEKYAGILQQELGDSVSFTYDSDYLQSNNPAIAHTLPLQQAPHLSQRGLLSFFDNLVAEGWLEQAQTRLLGKREISRFELLLAFGYDCAGAVSVIDPEPAILSDKLIDTSNTRDMAVLTSRASLSGVQPKLAIIKRGGRYYPARSGEVSTYIAKFPSQGHADLLYNEYLTTQAFKELLPDDDVAEIFIDSIAGQSEPALLIKRFDRTATDRIHFEEFNQLLGYKSTAKYDGSYKDMAHFISTTPHCLPAENFRLFGRIVAGLLLGNTDMHFKNFAMLHTTNGLRLTPAYDEVAAALYGYDTVALAMAGARDRRLSDLTAKHIIMLGQEFMLPSEAINMMIKQLEKHKDAAKQVVLDADVSAPQLKDKLLKLVEKRWNGTFASIGKLLSKKP